MIRPEARPVGFKIALFLQRNGTIAPADFATRWLAAGPLAGPAQHVHNAPANAAVPIENAPPAPFDGVDELLFASADEATGWLASGALRAWLNDRAALLDGEPTALAGTAWTLWQRAGDAPPDPVKILTLPVRRAGMAMADFVRHWIEVHAGLALSGPGVTERLAGLVSCPADQASLTGLAPAPFDGIGTILFESAESMAAEFAGSHYREVMAPDEPRFTDPARSRAMMVREIAFSPSLA